MIHKIFSVYDVQAEAYMKPLFAATKGLAIRGFTDAANDANSGFAGHLGDFRLCEIGEFDDSAGSLVSYDQPIAIGYASEFVKE